MRIKDVKKEVSKGFVLVDSEELGTGKMNVEDLQETTFKDAKKSGTPKIKNIVIAGGIADCGTLNLTERTNEEGNQFILIPGSATSSVTIEDTDAAPLLLFVCNLNKNKFQALSLYPVKDSDGTMLGYTFKVDGTKNLNIFGNQDTRFDGVNTYRPGSYGLRFRIQNNKTDTQGIMFKPEIASETNESIISAGLLAYTPKGAGNYVVRASGTIDEETGAHAGCFTLGEMLIPSGKNPQTLGTLGAAAVPVFGLGDKGPGWYLLEANGGGSSGGAESEIFISKISVNQENGSATSSNTYEQIKEAAAAGKFGILVYPFGGGLRLAKLSMVNDTAAVFENLFIGKNYNANLGLYEYSIDTDLVGVMADGSVEMMAPMESINVPVGVPDEVLVLEFDENENLGKTLLNSYAKTKILRFKSDENDDEKYMDLMEANSKDCFFNFTGVGPVNGVVSYVEISIEFSPYTDKNTITKTITPLQLQTT